jgi:hypothetical protein
VPDRAVDSFNPNPDPAIWLKPDPISFEDYFFNFLKIFKDTVPVPVDYTISYLSVKKIGKNTKKCIFPFILLSLDLDPGSGFRIYKSLLYAMQKLSRVSGFLLRSTHPTLQVYFIYLQ